MKCYWTLLALKISNIFLLCRFCTKLASVWIDLLKEKNKNTLLYDEIVANYNFHGFIKVFHWMANYWWMRLVEKRHSQMLPLRELDSCQRSHSVLDKKRAWFMAKTLIHSNISPLVVCKKVMNRSACKWPNSFYELLFLDSFYWTREQKPQFYFSCIEFCLRHLLQIEIANSLSHLSACQKNHQLRKQ